MATMFAATHPEVVRALVLYTPMPRAGLGPRLRVGVSGGRARRRMRPLIDGWGQGMAPGRVRAQRRR